MPHKILVVDDEANIRKVLKMSLEKLGHYRVATAATGEEGIKLTRQFKPDLIILDIRLPDMNGIDVLCYLKSEFPLSKTPVLMLSGLDDEDIRQQCHHEYCEEYVDKPFVIQDLLDRIQSILTRPQTPAKPES